MRVEAKEVHDKKHTLLYCTPSILQYNLNKKLIT